MAAAELHTDLQQWWAAQEFEGKEIYSLSEDGTLSLIDAPPLKARKITTLTLEDADLTLATLRDKFTPLHEEMVALMVEWKTVPDKLTLDRKITQQMENIASTYAIGNLLEIAQTLEEWHKEITTAIDANYEAKLEIVAKAVALIDNTNWKETTQAFKDLSDQYKVAGYLDRERNEALLNRLEDARASFYEKKKAHFESEDTDLMLNLDLKIELAEKAERLAQAESWKQGTEFFLSVVEEWKKIGRTLPKKNEELWQRIMTAKNNFFDRKKEFLNAQKIEQEANLSAKLELVAKAEALKDSKDYAKTTVAFGELLAEWKKIGKVPIEHSEPIWKRFIECQEAFFEAKKAHQSSTRQAQEANLAKKQAIIKRMEEIKNSNRWKEVTIEFNQLFDEWKTIGPVPYNLNDELWATFSSIRKEFFKRKDASREEREMQFEYKKSARLEQAHTFVRKLTREIEEEKEKLTDFNAALENITPGKKAKELKDHLEALISDSTIKIKRLGEKLEAAQEELNFVMANEKKIARQAYKK